MCFGPDAPPPAPPPLPAQAPPPVTKLEGAEGASTTDTALKANRGRSSLRIDKTVNAPGSAGSGLNIPS